MANRASCAVRCATGSERDSRAAKDDRKAGPARGPSLRMVAISSAHDVAPPRALAPEPDDEMDCGTQQDDDDGISGKGSRFDDEIGRASGRERGCRDG